MPGDVRLDAPAQRPVADGDQTRVGQAPPDRTVCAKQVTQTLSLLEPADEQDVEVLIAEMADRWESGLVDVEVDPVGDDAHRMTGEVASHEIARRLTHRD